MDTSEVKTNLKQEADNSAGFLQSDQRSTAASSQEDRLAAGISTVGLQARKLSRAQRKGISSAGSAEGTLIQYSTRYAAARLWLASAIMFLGVWSLNRETYVQSQLGTSASLYEARDYEIWAE
jgi:hypothetical protein